MEVLITIIAIFLSSVIQSTTGFGFALISIPILSLIYDPHWAITLTMLISFLTLSINVKNVYKVADINLVKKLLIGSLIGLPIGGVFFFYFDVHFLRLFISFTIILITVLLIFKRFIKRLMKKIEGSVWYFGALSGFLTFSVGLPGPPIMLYLEINNSNQYYYRANGILFLFCIYPIPLTVLLISGAITLEILKFLLILLPISYLGIVVGNKLHNVISKKTFILLTYTILFITGVSLIVSTLI